MNLTDKIIFGDNQFFGINHMSQRKSKKCLKNFYIDEILKLTILHWITELMHLCLTQMIGLN